MKKPEPYYKFSQYLKQHFGCRVYKVSIDAGFSCPNRDGKFSEDGCIYCDNRAFSLNTRPVRSNSNRCQDASDGWRGTSNGASPLEAQIEEGIQFGRKRYGAEKFIIYFQAYTNTYAPVEELKGKYDTVKKFEDIVGIAIGTRPDCINEEILALIQSYTQDYEVWLEYGLQSIHNKTLEFINRGHTYEDFLKAVAMTRKRPKIKICAHVIIGLPKETKEEMLETARALGQLKLEGIKIHPLHIIKGTKLEELFNTNLYKPLEINEYVSIVTEFLQYLWPQTVIQRITADCPRELLLAPLWILEKNKLLSEIENRLKENNSFQGKLSAQCKI